MRTIKRNVAEIAQIKTNGTKYLNQFEFKGIMEDNNIFGVDQNSCRDTQNVFVSFENRLKSRPTLQKDNLPELFTSLPYLHYDLIDIEQFGSNKVYVFKHDEMYDLIFVENDLTYCELNGLSEYKLTSVEHYIICFNNINAKVIDLSTYVNYGHSATNFSTKENYIGYYIKDGDNYILVTNDNYNSNLIVVGTTDAYKHKWVPLSDYTYIPVTQETTGSSTKQLEDVNTFIGQTKHVYNWSNNSQPDMSSENGSAEVTVITPNGKQDSYELSSANKDTDYRIIKKTNCLFNGGIDLISASSNGGIICVANSISFEVSFNNGETFDKYYYPAYEGTFCNIAKVSDDGQYFFFVTTVGVYRCNLGDFTWSNVNKPFVESSTTIDTILSNSKNTLAYFKDGTTYSFITYDSNTVKFSACINGTLRNYNRAIDGANDLQPIINYINVRGGYGNTNYFENRFSITYNSEQNIYCITYIGPNATTFDNLTILTLFVTNHSTNWVLSIAGSITNVKFAKQITNNGNSVFTFEREGHTDTFRVDLDCLIGKITSGDVVGIWYRNYISIVTTYESQYSSTITVNTDNPLNTNNELAYIQNDMTPISMTGGYVMERISGYLFVKSYINNIWYNTAFSGSSMFAFGDNYYFVKYENGKNRLYTNKLYTNSVTSEEDIAQITYTVGSTGSYTKVPQVTYSDTEIYLGSGSTLQITQNRTDLEDNTKTLFYLPNSNDQKFIDEITGMINISTTEVALFFKDNIIICSKVQDENISTGYRYDYYNTKLSVGIRLGDSIINTIEGQYTIFPTNRGLAIMNYQAFMATTDQVVQYITDNVSMLWTKFYENSTMIKIKQWRTYLILTNGSGDILLYNIISSAWWRWQIPINVYNVITDQEKLWCINKLLYKFKDQKELKLNGTLEQRRYYDFSETEKGIEINWFIKSQPLHFGAPTYYKNIKQLIFQFYDVDENTSYDKTLDAQVKLYRKKITVTEPENIEFKIEGLRTFVKRFNYWKINELQWAISNDTETTTPSQFEINSISVKYEIGEEVR